MRAHFEMPSYEFIAELRDAAIKSKASEQVIANIDSLADIDLLETEIEKVGGELHVMEGNRDDLEDAIGELLAALPDIFDDLRELDAEAATDIDKLRTAITNAKDAVSRSGAK